MSRDGLPIGEGTSKPNDVADPHPADEEHYDQIPHPGGASSKGKDIGPNPSVHDGKPKPRPKNVKR